MVRTISIELQPQKLTMLTDYWRLECKGAATFDGRTSNPTLPVDFNLYDEQGTVVSQVKVIGEQTDNSSYTLVGRIVVPRRNLERVVDLHRTKYENVTLNISFKQETDLSDVTVDTPVEYENIRLF